jgi:hypothetical protein
MNIRSSVATIAFFVAMTASLARAQARLEGPGQARSGFALEVHLSTGLFSLGQQIGAFSTVQGGLFAGAKLGRVIVGLAFDLQRLATGTGSTGMNETTTARTAILFSPGVRVALARSRDQRVELFGELDFGFGHFFVDNTPSPQGSQAETSNFHFAYTLGPGLRYWVHPQFAVSALGALNGQFEFDSTTTMIGNIKSTSTSSTGNTAIVAALQLTAVF